MKRFALPSWAILALAVLLGLALRLALWGTIPRTGLISDEGEYLSAAAWLSEGRGFDWYQGYLWTRAPLYPLFVAAHMRLFGQFLAALYASQIILSLLQIVLVYLLTGRLTPDWRIRGTAALLTALFLPLALYTQIALSETLYITLLLAGFLALERAGSVSNSESWHQATDNRQTGSHSQASPMLPTHPSPFSQLFYALLAGMLFGLATLTRSLTLGFLPFVVLWLLRTGSKSEVQHTTTQNSKLKTQNLKLKTLVFILATLLVMLPWTAYNSWLYGGPVLVDTSGSFNVLLGARTAADGKRSDAQVRDYVLGLLGQPQSAVVSQICRAYPGQLPSQAARQSAMTSEGLCLIARTPLAFAQKSLSELVDLFQINYTGAERFTNGFSTGRLPGWYVLLLFVLDDTLYVFSLPLALIGWAVIRRQRPVAQHPKGSVQHGKALQQQEGLNQAAGTLSNIHNDDYLALPKTHTGPGVSVFTHQPSALAGLIGLWWLYNLLVAPLLFAINRFRVPLMPFAFMCVPFGCIWLWKLLATRLHGQKQRASLWMALNLILAGLLFLIASTPYAYFEARAPGADSHWASYLGPYPSSLDISGKALQARTAYQADQRFAQALAQGDFEQAELLLQSGTLGFELRRLGPAILRAYQGQSDAALELLPAADQIDATKDVSAALLRGDLLRTTGNPDAALAQLSKRYVDDANPLEWAWIWLKPASTQQINLGGSTDIGYVRGCYPGEGDPGAGGNFRWCTDAAQLRFPGAGRNSSQTLLLRVDARAWKLRATQAPELSVWLGDTLLGKARPDLKAVSELHFSVPPTVKDTQLVFTVRTATFVPDAARYNSQQGTDVVGQVQYLGVRIDWAELVP